MCEEMNNRWKESEYQKARQLAEKYQELEYITEEELDQLLEESNSSSSRNYSMKNP